MIMKLTHSNYCFDVWMLLVAVLLVRVSASIYGTDHCILNFTEQPVTSVDCNVYESDLEVLTCRVESIDTAEVPDIQDISIKWFFYNNTEYELTIGTSPIQRTGGNGSNLTVTSMLHISGTSQPNASFVSEGFYYCYCIVYVLDVVALLHQSQRFEVLNREEYLQQATSCSERTFSTALETCAVSLLRNDFNISATTASIFSGLTGMTNSLDGEDTTAVDETSSPPSSSNADSGSSGGSGSLEVWIYVLVAVVAVFAMIIVILAIMCVGLHLRLSKIRETNTNSLQYIQTYDTVEVDITEVRIGTHDQLENNPAYGVLNDNIELDTCAAYTTGPKIGAHQVENNPAYDVLNDNIELETCPAYTTAAGSKIGAQLEEHESSIQ